MYASAENAYAALDFTGLGHITEDAFLKCHVVKNKLPQYTKEQFRAFFVH